MTRSVHPLSAQDVNVLLPQRWRWSCFRSRYNLIGITWTQFTGRDVFAVDVSFGAGPWLSFTVHGVRSAGESSE